MRHTRPLPHTHPEFSIIEYSGFCEYRVENWRLARDGSGRIVHGTVMWTWVDPVVPVVLSVIWQKLRWSVLIGIFLVLLTAVFIWFRCSQVLHECHRGFPTLRPLFVSRRFIHLSTLQDFVIHEGLRRWDVRYFLAIFKRSSSRDPLIEVAFENVWPHFAVLLEVYRGVHGSIFGEDIDFSEEPD